MERWLKKVLEERWMGDAWSYSPRDTLDFDNAFAVASIDLESTQAPKGV
jgi:hypothetical protein